LEQGPGVSVLLEPGGVACRPCWAPPGLMSTASLGQRLSTMGLYTHCLWLQIGARLKCFVYCCRPVSALLGPEQRWIQRSAAGLGMQPLAPSRRSSSRSSPWPPPGPGRWCPMAAVAEGVAAGAAATAHRHRGRLVQPQLVGDTAGAQVGAIAKPAVMAAAAAAELVHASRQVQRLGARGGRCRLGHDGFFPPLGLGPVWCSSAAGGLLTLQRSDPGPRCSIRASQAWSSSWPGRSLTMPIT
jgi:hypothetical protein